MLQKREYLLKIIEDLVQIPSVTESALESEPGLWIKKRISSLDYFKEHPEKIQWIETPLEGATERLYSLVVRVDAAVHTKRTILMIGHYDVVAINVYGEIAPDAFNPNKLSEHFGTDGEDVMYGRGSMDMKCGVALEIDLLEEFAGNINLFDVNLVVAFVGDEENASAGMRGVLPALSAMQREGLDFLAAVNTEPGEAGDSGEVGPKVFLGTLGKLMPSFYVRGCGSHVGNFYSGFSSALTASRLVTYAEGNPYLADPLHGRCEPSWICLDMGVIKNGYSVTVPERSYVYFNCFTTTNTPSVIMEQMRYVAGYALAQTSAQLTDSHRGLIASGYEGVSFTPPNGSVYSLEEITCIARGKYGESFDEDLRQYIESIPMGDMRDRCIKVMDRVADMSGKEGPYVVCFFLPPWLPVRTDLTDDLRDKAVVEAARSIGRELFDRHGMDMKEVEFFAGLCDLSYVGAKVSPDDMCALENNLPGCGCIYKLPLKDMQSLGMPVLNLGPSGEDPHKKTERLHLHYSLDILPGLLRTAVRELSRLVP